MPDRGWLRGSDALGGVTSPRQPSSATRRLIARRMSTRSARAERVAAEVSAARRRRSVGTLAGVALVLGVLSYLAYQQSAMGYPELLSIDGYIRASAGKVPPRP